MNKLIDEYDAYLHNLHLSENTLVSYVRDVRAFGIFIHATNKSDIVNVTNKIIDGYIEALKESGRANSTISRNVAALRKFYGYMQETGKISDNPVKGVNTPRVEKKIPDSLTTREINKLLNQPRTTDLKGIRDKAMLELLYATGIKVSELINLTVRDIDIHGEMINCENGNKQRYIPIGKVASEALQIYIKKARPMMIHSSGVKNLFVNCSGTPLTRQGFWKILRYYAESAKIKTPINAQTLRNSFAVHLLQNGADITAVSEMLGHGDVVTTRIYDKVLQNNIKRIYKKAHPRA